MARQTKKLVTAVFRDRYDAEQAFDYLHAKGYTHNEINVLMSDKTRSTFYSDDEKEPHHAASSMVTEGMGVGGAIGTAIRTPWRPLPRLVPASPSPELAPALR